MQNDNQPENIIINFCIEYLKDKVYDMLSLQKYTLFKPILKYALKRLPIQISI